MINELPRWLQAALAIALCVGIALWAQFKSVDSLAPALLALPMALLGLGYLSLNGALIFLDLHLAASLALLFLAVLRYWNVLRQQYWRSPPVQTSVPLMLWPLSGHQPWYGAPLNRLIDALEQHAPACRLIVVDANVTWPARLRWPELARYVAVVGPQDVLLAARAGIEATLRQQVSARAGELVPLGVNPVRERLAHASLAAWATFHASRQASEKQP